MRISDWSSDVCSSDLRLAPVQDQGRLARLADARLGGVADVEHTADGRVDLFEFRDAGQQRARALRDRGGFLQRRARRQLQAEVAAAQVRGRDEGGREIGRASCRVSVSERVDLGGRGVIKKKKKKESHK